MKRSISFRPTLLALVLATNFPVAHAAVPKDMLVIGKAADPQTLDPAVTIDNNDWTVTYQMVATMYSISGGIAHFRGQRFCLPPSGLISLVMVFAICLTRKQEESSHDPTRSGHSTTAFEFPRF